MADQATTQKLQSIPCKSLRRNMAGMFSIAADAASLTGMRVGPRAVFLFVLGILAMGPASNSAKAGECDCAATSSTPCLPCNGLNQTPDYGNLVIGEQATVTEDDLNGPWIETIKRVKQCVDMSRETEAAIGSRITRGTKTREL